MNARRCIGKIYKFDTYAEAFEFAKEANSVQGQWLMYGADMVQYESGSEALYIDLDVYYMDPREPDRHYLTEDNADVNAFVGYKIDKELNGSK